MDLPSTIGHLHVVLLHLPIGLFFGVAAVEAVCTRAAGGNGLLARSAMRVLMWLLAGSAAMAAGTGYILSREPGYEGSTLTLHMWLGISVAAMSVATLVLHERVVRRARSGAPGKGAVAVFRLGLLLTVGLLVPAGHLGGTLTHGENFLLAARVGTGESETPAVPAPGDGTEFTTRIRPILEANCSACHGATKRKGGLALHTEQAILEGGRGGPVIVDGDPGASELLRRLRLPVDDDDHMPPAGKRQPTREEVLAVEAWIASGASFESPATGGRVAADSDADTATPRRGAAGVPADPAALGALQSALVHVQPIEPGSPLLLIDFGAPAGAGLVTDEHAVKLLGPVAGQVADLSLARSSVTDESVRTIAAMTHLRRLDLSHTSVTDAGLARLHRLSDLEELNLVGTAVTDDLVSALAAMPGLRRVYLWSTKLTPDGLAALRAACPDLYIESGSSLAGQTLEVEEPPKLTKARPPAPAPVAGATDPRESESRPKNSKCPVTGDAVDPQYVILYEGKRIGFCCPNCPKQFWVDPAKYSGHLGE